MIKQKKNKTNILFKIIGVLVLIVLVSVGSLYGYQQYELRKDQEFIDQLFVPLNQSQKTYGTKEVKTKNEKYFLSYVSYPKGDNEQLNQLIERKLKEIQTDFEAKAILKKIEETREKPILQIDYETVDSSQDVLAILFEIRETNLIGNQTDYKEMVVNFDRTSNLEIDILKYFHQLGNLRQVSQLFTKQLNSNINSVDYTNIQQVLAPVQENYQSLYLNKDHLMMKIMPKKLGKNQTQPVVLDVDFKTIESLLTIEYKDNQYQLIKPNETIPPKVVKEKVISLTFDDGPFAPVDLKIIEYLKSMNANATFFVIGNRVSTYPQSIQAMVTNGFEVGNHSYSHPDYTKISLAEVDEQIDKTNQAIEAITNQKVKLIRLPYGNTNATVSAHINFPMINWSIDSEDWKWRNPQAIYNSVMKQAHPGGIVVMHSIYNSTYESLKLIVPKLQSEGYRFVSVSELYDIYGIKPKLHEINRFPQR